MADYGKQTWVYDFGLIISVGDLNIHLVLYSCFIETGPPLYYGLVLPIAIILLINTITFARVVHRLLRSNLGGTVQQRSKVAQISQRLRNAFAISVLMGLTWVFGFFAIEGAKFAFSFIFCLLNSLQGVAVFVLFCLRQEDVKKRLGQFIRSICNLPEDTTRTTSMTASTGVVSTTSRPKYGDSEIGLTNLQPLTPQAAETSTHDQDLTKGDDETDALCEHDDSSKLSPGHDMVSSEIADNQNPPGTKEEHIAVSPTEDASDTRKDQDKEAMNDTSTPEATTTQPKPVAAEEAPLTNLQTSSKSSASVVVAVDIEREREAVAAAVTDPEGNADNEEGVLP